MQVEHQVEKAFAYHFSLQLAGIGVEVFRRPAPLPRRWGEEHFCRVAIGDVDAQGSDSGALTLLQNAHQFCCRQNAGLAYLNRE